MYPIRLLRLLYPIISVLRRSSLELYTGLRDEKEAVLEQTREAERQRMASLGPGAYCAPRGQPVPHPMLSRELRQSSSRLYGDGDDNGDAEVMPRPRPQRRPSLVALDVYHGMREERSAHTKEAAKAAERMASGLGPPSPPRLIGWSGRSSLESSVATAAPKRSRS